MAVINIESPTYLTPFSSHEGMNRLSRARCKLNWGNLAQNYRTQENPVICGPTTGAIVVNALHGTTIRTWSPMAFAEHSRHIVPMAKFRTELSSRSKGAGMTLSQMQQALVEFEGLIVSKHLVHCFEPRQKRLIVRYLSRPGRCVVVNYQRSKLGQNPGGHFSPLAAYDEVSDSFLILDTNPSNGPWVWVASLDLFSAMAEKDQNSYRGFLLIRRSR